jgi:hypothetical protein
MSYSEEDFKKIRQLLFKMSDIKMLKMRGVDTSKISYNIEEIRILLSFYPCNRLLLLSEHDFSKNVLTGKQRLEQISKLVQEYKIKCEPKNKKKYENKKESECDIKSINFGIHKNYK